MKLAEAISLTTSQAKEITDLRAALKACEQKWYNEGFADAEKSAELVVSQARRLGFEAGWFAALQALGVPEDSLPDSLPKPHYRYAGPNITC